MSADEEGRRILYFSWRKSASGHVGVGLWRDRGGRRWRCRRLSWTWINIYLMRQEVWLKLTRSRRMSLVTGAARASPLCDVWKY